MTRCERCKGEGHYDHHTPGFEGVPERDNEVVCSECCGLGYPEAAEMLATIIAIRDADRMSRALGAEGLSLAPKFRELIARTIAKVTTYSIERYGELRAKGMVRDA